MEENPFPHKILDICVDDVEEKFREECKDKVLVGTGKWCLPKRYVAFKEQYFNFNVKPNDIWIMGFPRSGTTLVQEMAWLIVNDLDFKTAKEVRNQDRISYFELEVIITGSHIIDTYGKLTWNKLTNMKERRFLKTHLPFSLLPQNLLEKGGKIIYVARNPKDVIVSYYHFVDLLRPEGFKFKFKEHCELFMQGLHIYAPYLEHIEQAWKLRNKENFMFIFYEDIIKNKRETLRRVATFLGKSLSEKDTQDLIAHLDIDNFKKYATLNHIQLQEDRVSNMKREFDFIRKGIIGDWKNYADSELDEIVNQWIKDGLGGKDITFQYE